MAEAKQVKLETFEEEPTAGSSGDGLDQESMAKYLISFPIVQEYLGSDLEKFCDLPAEHPKSIFLQLLLKTTQYANTPEVVNIGKLLTAAATQNPQNYVGLFLEEIRNSVHLAEARAKKIRKDLIAKLMKEPCSSPGPDANSAQVEVAGNSESSERQSSPSTSVKLDGFLFSSKHEFLTNQDFKSPARCKNCGSTNTQLLECVSHSCSAEGVLQLILLKLPKLDGKHVLDIGSGLGSILYSVFYFSRAETITGLEINSEFCRIVKIILRKYKMGQRVKVVEGDLRNNAGLLANQDVIFFNNAFEYFVSKEVQVDLWKLIKSNVKAGTYLVTNPSLETLLSTLQPDVGINVNEWVTSTKEHENSQLLDAMENTDEKFQVYIVK